jgi:cellulose synthase operon protein C
MLSARAFPMRLTFPLLFALSFAAAACGSGRGRYGHPAHHAERTTRADVAVSEDAFPVAVRDLLASEPGSRERQLRLAGVIARQMARVSTRFKAKNRDQAVASFAGAMYLVRAGELTTEMLGPNGYDALKSASEEFARKGDEGRARAAYEMLLRVAPAPEKNEIKAHLDAINAWTKDVGGDGPMRVAGALESAAVTRLLLEPSVEARDDAVAKTFDFIDKAIAFKQARRARAQVTREEGLEAVRALETGTTILAAIHVRNGDAHAALTVLEKANQKDPQLTRPELMSALKGVVERPDSDRWLDLARVIRPPQQKGRDDEDFGRDADLLRVAAFVSACEAFRLDSTSPEPAAFVAATLVDLGMGDASPAILSDAAKTQKDPRIIGLGLAVAMQAMGRALDMEEPDTARRAFKASEPLLAAADALKGRVQPSPARAYALMGEIEIREGRLDAAKQLLNASNERERIGAVQLNLARLDWHEGKSKDALERLRVALGTEDVVKDPALRAEVLLVTSDITHEQGDANAARKPLADALKDLAKARSTSEAEDRARVERLISRVLDRFGAAKSAEKALERALEAAPRDKRQSAATIGQIVGRAFVRGDLAAAREGLGRGVAAELGRDDIVYEALWVRLLERQQRKSDDPSAERILLQSADDPRWIGKIAAFGAGKIKAVDLVAAAKTPTQKTEALFYAAIDRKASGDAKGADEGLRQVLSSPGLDLVEWGLAREIISGARAQLGGPVPEVGLP